MTEKSLPFTRADIQRRYRQRLRDRIRIVPVEVDELLRSRLVRAGYLTVAESRDIERVAAALLQIARIAAP